MIKRIKHWWANRKLRRVSIKDFMNEYREQWEAELARNHTLSNDLKAAKERIEELERGIKYWKCEFNRMGQWVVRAADNWKLYEDAQQTIALLQEALSHYDTETKAE